MSFICYISHMFLHISPSGVLKLFGEIAENFIFFLNYFLNFMS
jgi:hypothetical protein